MGKKKVFSVGFRIPGGDIDYVPFASDQSLLDADIVLFAPTLGRTTASERYKGKLLLSEGDSARVPPRLSHWQSELRSALAAGKLVIVLLAKP